MPEKDLRVLQALVIVRNREMNLVSEFLRPLQKAGGLIRITRRILAQAEFDHLVHYFRVKEALLTRLSLTCTNLQCIYALLIGNFVIQGSRARGDGKRGECQNNS